MVEVNNLSVQYMARHRRPVSAVRGVTFEVHDRELVGLVGESGCGKTTLGYAMAGLLDSGRHAVQGKILFDGQDILAMSDEQLRRLRWVKFSMVLQGGMNAFNPVIKIKQQFFDGMQEHSSMTHQQMMERVRYLLSLVKLDAEVAERYPHELSGGMKQRVAIAMALSLNPKLVIMDEPTTALDVVVQHAIVKTLVRLQKELGFAVLFISHDLGVVLEIAERIVIMYAGQTVEINSAENILHRARHPYTQALMQCYADPRSDQVQISGIEGSPPDLSLAVVGCAFAARCPKAWDRCLSEAPVAMSVDGGTVACHLYEEEVPR